MNKGSQEAKDRMAKARAARKSKVEDFDKKEFTAVTVFRTDGNLFVMRAVKVKDGKVVEIIDMPADIQSVQLARAQDKLEDMAS